MFDELHKTFGIIPQLETYKSDKLKNLYDSVTDAENVNCSQCRLDVKNYNSKSIADIMQSLTTIKESTPVDLTNVIELQYYFNIALVLFAISTDLNYIFDKSVINTHDEIEAYLILSYLTMQTIANKIDPTHKILNLTKLNRTTDYFRIYINNFASIITNQLDYDTDSIYMMFLSTDVIPSTRPIYGELKKSVAMHDLKSILSALTNPSNYKITPSKVISVNITNIPGSILDNSTLPSIYESRSNMDYIGYNKILESKIEGMQAIDKMILLILLQKNFRLYAVLGAVLRNTANIFGKHLINKTITKYLECNNTIRAEVCDSLNKQVSKVAEPEKLKIQEQNKKEPNKEQKKFYVTDLYKKEIAEAKAKYSLKSGGRLVKTSRTKTPSRVKPSRTKTPSRSTSRVKSKTASRTKTVGRPRSKIRIIQK
jgi:hypothetical protein